ncbi:MAG: PSD1 and planctomycete cytochrome C domain-containing protein [Acidobacteriota bacterium]
MKRFAPLFCILLLAAALLVPASAFQQREARQRPVRRVAFTRDIQPILSQSCLGCHGATQQMGSLRLDSPEAVLAGGVSGPVVVPGKGAGSLLVRRLSGTTDGPQMPMEGPKLTANQIALIQRWIDGGAAGLDVSAAPAAVKSSHWAYQPLQRPALPPVKNETWVRNPIDRFVLARLEKEGVKPSPEASRETLIRRVSLDLVGLPPTLEDVRAFVSDTSPDAYQKVVDRLLSSPHYGERWARPWLDLARYADTQGYEKDNRRSIWLYRDWVIAAFNDDMPFDQFTIEQIAGDMLPNSSSAQKIASGFHRNSMINEEGGIDPEEYRVAAVLDRVGTTASVFLGTTLACAQCHNHKYDPFTQEEFYRFYAFFNSAEPEIKVLGGGEREGMGPKMELPITPAMVAHRSRIEESMTAAEALLNRVDPALDVSQAVWEQEMAAAVVPWTALDPVRTVSAGGAGLTVLEDHSVLASGANPDRDTFIIVADTALAGITGVRIEALTHPTLVREGSSRGPRGRFVMTGFEVEAASLTDPARSVRVGFTDAASDQSGYTPDVKDAIDDDPRTGWTISTAGEAARRDRQAIFLAAAPFGFAGGTRLTIRLRHDSALPQQVLGRFRLAVTTAEDPGRGAKVPVALQSVLQTQADARTEAQRRALREYFRGIDPALEPVRERLVGLREFWGELTSPSTLVMKEQSEARKTQILLRGSFLTKGKEVRPGVPAVLPPVKKEQPADRLGLARWLVDAYNPLTPRVAVNRFWMHYFGRGLVETVEDFGTQGDRPTHPELLDWLAAEFIEQKWSMKAFHRLVVTSATYRQNSAVAPDLLERDPDNRLLARGPRRRLEAEMVRDNALAVAGLLSPRVGGPSVFPPQPGGIWNLVYNDDKWRTSAGEDRYRRGLYTFWRRTAPYPMFTTFDAPSRELVCTRRIQTNTPLQSLTTLNDPTFFDAARALALRMLAQQSSGLRERILYGFALCTARAPEGKEIDRLVGLFEQERAHFAQNLKAASEIANGGDIRPGEGVDPADFAAWTVVANVLLNLDETLTKG